MIAPAGRKDLALLRSLRRGRERRETGLFLVEGARLGEELAATPGGAEVALIAESRLSDERLGALAAALEARGARVLSAPDARLEQISDTVNSQGFVAAARWERVKPALKEYGPRAVVLALDGVADPGNVGTVIRTAAWFGVDRVLLGEECADLLNPKVVRATMGGVFHVPVEADIPSLARRLEGLKEQGFAVAVAAAEGDTDWRAWAAPKRAALVLGGEARGVRPPIRRLADRIAAIPRRGCGESLNVAVSAGILLSALTE